MASLILDSQLVSKWGVYTTSRSHYTQWIRYVNWGFKLLCWKL